MEISFPQKYNVGGTSNGEPGDPTMSKNVKVKVSNMENEADAYWIDYLFEFADFKVKDVYGVYDPEITSSTSSPSSPSSSPPPSGSTTSASGSALVSHTRCVGFPAW